MSELDEVYARCTNVLPGHGPRRSMQTVFQELAAGLQGDEYLDVYGEGDYIASFEAEAAEMFGKEAAVFLPSGTMAQQIALRIWCEQRRDFTVAMHPTAHLELAEHLGYQYLHNIKRIQFGAPEFLGSRILNVSDLERLGKQPGAILLELPYRPLGGELPAWEDLAAMSEWARQRSIPFHLDGARIWSCRPFYQRSYREIAGLFDSLYVSFYKDLGGLAGAMLLGSASFIKEARLWQRRMGGNLVSLAPYLVSARLGMQRVVPQIDRWVERAQQVAEALAQYDGVFIRPGPPHVNFFQLYIRGDAETLLDRHLELARQTGTFLFFRMGASVVPGISVGEIHCWERSLQFDLTQLPGFMERLLAG